MNVKKTRNYFNDHNVVALKANKAKSSEVGEKLIELGNSQQAIPFYAVYAPGLDQPITFAPGIMSSDYVIKQIEKAIGHPQDASPTSLAETEESTKGKRAADSAPMKPGVRSDSGKVPDSSKP